MSIQARNIGKSLQNGNIFQSSYNYAISINFCNQRGGLLQPPGFLTSRPNFCVKLFMGMFSGSRKPKVIVKIFYLYRVTLKVEVIVCSWKLLPLGMTIHLQAHGVAPQHLFIDFRTP